MKNMENFVINVKNSDNNYNPYNVLINWRRKTFTFWQENWKSKKKEETWFFIFSSVTHLSLSVLYVCIVPLLSEVIFFIKARNASCDKEKIHCAFLLSIKYDVSLQ